jgi:hypothetical protein
MTENASTGVWSYTTPLPSGTFTYGFYVNCTSPPPGLTGCTELADPSNPPWNTSGSVEPDSQVYVPSDPRFGTPNMSWEAPNRHVHGSLFDVSYPDPQSTDPVGSRPLAIYLPPDYSPHRRVPYPTLYLSHAAAATGSIGPPRGREPHHRQSNRGADGPADGDRHDRLQQPRFMQPFPPDEDASCYATDVSNYVIPYVGPPRVLGLEGRRHHRRRPVPPGAAATEVLVAFALPRRWPLNPRPKERAERPRQAEGQPETATGCASSTARRKARLPRSRAIVEPCRGRGRLSVRGRCLLCRCKH